MPTLLGTAWTPEFNGRPTRMSPEDRELWLRWWPNIREGTERLYFDVGLGEGYPAPKDADDRGKYMWLRNTQKRADVVVERANEVWLVELRYAAQSSAIGRLQVYKLLWAQDDPIGKPLKLFLVTNYRDLDVEALASQLGIAYLIV